jgi:hypothetical protein
MFTTTRTEEYPRKQQDSAKHCCHCQCSSSSRQENVSKRSPLSKEFKKVLSPSIKRETVISAPLRGFAEFETSSKTASTQTFRSNVQSTKDQEIFRLKQENLRLVSILNRMNFIHRKSDKNLKMFQPL